MTGSSQSSVFHPCSIRGYLLAALFLIGLASLAGACNVPVFRFALERWRADAYEAVLFHRGPISAADAEQLRPLEDLQDQGLANLTLRTVDLAALDEASEEGAADAALFAALDRPEGATLVVKYPPHLNIARPVWVGRPAREKIAMLADSPLRQELVRRLAAGETTVWLLLESGNAEQDVAAAAMLEAELKKLEQELKLPELTASPEDAILIDAPLKVEFSMLRVPRSAVAEEALVAMLIGCESDLAERSDPMVFPVFGRGRALLPLIGAGITEKNIHDSAAFLVGACSCEVKELNPGFDLLLKANWDELLTKGGVPLSSAAIPAPAIPEKAELVPIPAGSSATRSKPKLRPTAAEAFQRSTTATFVSPTGWLLGGSILAGVVLIAVVVTLSTTRTREPQS